MIGIVDVEIQAANPQMPLYPMRAFVNSPSSVRVRNVPTEVGAWKITSVRVVVAYPDSSIKTADCVLAGSVWVATVAGCAVSGKTENGFTVFASGVDENGDAVSNYCLGKGAVEILQADGTLSPDAPSYYVHLFDEAPTAPNEGDMWPTADGFVIWQDGEAHALGGGSSITIDPSLSPTSENPVQNKVVAKALYTGFTEWVCVPSTYNEKTLHVERENDEWNLYADDQFLDPPESAPDDTTSLTFSVYGVTATRHLITPTKTSQLTNDSGFLTQHQDVSGKLDGAAAYPAWKPDRTYQVGEVVSYKGRIWKCIDGGSVNIPPDDSMGRFIWGDSPVTIDDLKQDALTSAQIAAVNSGATAAKVATWDGYAAQIAAKASLTDLPYAMVTPGEWEFSGVPEGVTDVSLSWGGTTWGYTYAIGTHIYSGVLPMPIASPYDGNELSLTFSIGSSTVTATRASLPGHLLDRAGNRVEVTGDTTLTLPALVNAGRLRDFLVRLEISGSTVPTITFQGQGSEAPNGADEITYETDGDEFPVPDEEGTWLYSFTETAAHKFAVSLKKVNTVAQGGS